MTFQVDLFITQEICLLSECLNDPADEFEESHAQGELSALYILWISKAANHPLYPACFYSNHVFARIDSCAAKGLSLTGKLLRVLLDAASSGCEWEAEREAAFRFHYGAEGPAGKSLPTGEDEAVDECARPGRSITMTT